MDSIQVCVSCNAKALKILRKHENYKLYECRSCAMQFWQPFKQLGHSHYESIKKYAERNMDPLSHPLYPSQKLFLKTLPRRGGRLLDIGCGTGRFLAEAKKCGYNVAGFDFDENAIKMARNFFGLENAFVSDVSAFLSKSVGQKFDVITMFEILEHLDNYTRVDSISNFLADDGLFILSMPWRESWKVFLEQDLPPNHLSKWNEKSIKNFLGNRGLEVIKIKKLPVVFNRYMMRFNDWTKSYLSFSTTSKLEKIMKVRDKNGGQKISQEKVDLLKMLSIAKLYGLFFLPALLLYVYLWSTGERNRTGLYVVAKQKTKTA